MSTGFLREADELIRARYSILYVVTWEEDRARRLLGRVAQRQGKQLFEWSVTEGLRRVAGAPQGPQKNAQRQREPLGALNAILQADASAIYLLKDFHTYLEAPEIVRTLRDLSYALRHSHKTIVLLGPVMKLPTELEKTITILDLPLPDYDELAHLLDSSVTSPAASRHFTVDLNESDRDALLKAARGLTLAEAENAFARAIVRDRKLDGSDVDAVLDEKMQVIRKSGLLEYYERETGFDGIGGMDLLKEWLRKRAQAFSKEAQGYGLPQPRGMLLMGVQGCGKSLMAKSVASLWRMPLLRMDMSRIFQGFIGSSEENMRRALEIARSLAPIVLWVDEIEKAFAGMEGSSATDGGTTARVIGQFLTWMQEKRDPVFVVATANNVRHLPPELLRKGRVDEIFFVDLPRLAERKQILEIHLKRRRRNPASYDVDQLAAASEGFSGAEIEQAIISAMHDSFFDRRELETRDVVRSFQETVPLSRTMREQIDELRSWASKRARPVAGGAQPETTRLGAG